MLNEMELLKKQIKENIQLYISNNELDKAMSLIEEYLKIDLSDVEIYSMKSVGLIMQGKMNEAESVLKQGLSIDNLSFDLNYNLGYLYEQMNRFNEAVKYYKTSLENCEDQNIKTDIIMSIEKISSEHDIRHLEDKSKIAFFVKEGMDSFLGDIIEGVSDEYEIRKIIVNDINQIQEGMQWADICWFEWCDELVAYGSTHSLSKSKKIICRLHSYEAFTEYPSNVNWENVDKVIFVGKNIRDFVIDVYKLDESKAVVIPNGVDINKYNFREREPGFNIAYVGYLNYKKGPMLLLHTFKAMYDKDNRYKLHIAGKFQDHRDILYFNQMIEEFGIKDNVYYDGWQDNLDEWLEDKNYILCTSVLESQNMSVMQAMCKGIKPIIHNFVGAKTIYDSKYVWNTIDEAIDILRDNTYNSKEYFEFIQNNYSLESELSSVKDLLWDNVSKKCDFNYSDYWNTRLNNKFDIEGVGYIGLGQIYNEFLYKSRFEILSYIIDKLFGNIKNKSVLELGPGIGMFTDYFYKNDVDKYYAIDISKKSQEELSEKFKIYKFMLGDIAEKENYPKDKYDLIFAADVLLHLTDEEKYKNVLNNLSNVLENEGYIVLFDPITLINSKSISPHLVIRDIKYIERILKENDLEILGFMPSAFFMNYPFDKDIIKDKAYMAQNIFDLIQAAFGSADISDITKQDLAQWLSVLDKQCLIRNKFGLSQKVIIIKKKNNNRLIDFNIDDVWNYNDIKIQLDNNERMLNENNEIKKYDLVNIFKNNVKDLICLEQGNELKEQPLVTVGIINYNGKEYLKNCIESYVNQTYPNIEILLIDDCSTDGSKEIIQEYENNYENIRGIYHEINSGGASKGIQDIIENAKGEYFQWIACDDFVEKNSVELFVDYLERNSNKDYVYSNYNIVDKNNIKTYNWNYAVPGHDDIIRHIFHNSSGVIPMNCMYKLEFFKRNKISWLIYRDNDFSCDTLNTLQFIKYKWNYGKINEELINYRVHSNNLSNNLEKRIKSLVSIFDYIIKNFNEEIYFSEVNWADVENRKQFKNYKIADFYYNQIKKHIDMDLIPGYVKGSVSKEEVKKYCLPLVSEGVLYIEEGLKNGNAYEDKFKELNEKYFEFIK